MLLRLQTKDYSDLVIQSFSIRVDQHAISNITQGVWMEPYTYPIYNDELVLPRTKDYLIFIRIANFYPQYVIKQPINWLVFVEH